MRRTHAHTARASPRAPATLELSIRGDELECDRIQLEHNLQQTDLSLHLSSAAGSNDDASVEYPRHNSAPSPHAEFRSFDRSGFDEDGPSQMQGWSYRTVDEDDAGHRYGESISTAAHHASAVTLSAGLGGRGARREVSLSGAEYDPERPLQDMIAGIGRKFPVSSSAVAKVPLISPLLLRMHKQSPSTRSSSIALSNSIATFALAVPQHHFAHPNPPLRPHQRPPQGGHPHTSHPGRNSPINFIELPSRLSGRVMPSPTLLCGTLDQIRQLSSANSPMPPLAHQPARRYPPSRVPHHRPLLLVHDLHVQEHARRMMRSKAPSIMRQLPVHVPRSAGTPPPSPSRTSSCCRLPLRRRTPRSQEWRVALAARLHLRRSALRGRQLRGLLAPRRGLPKRPRHGRWSAVR